MVYVEKFMECDLELDEVAMVIHRFLKRLDIRLQIVSITVEKVEYDAVDEKDDEMLIAVERYTVVILSSTKPLTNIDLMKEYEKIQSKGFKVRGDK